VAIYNLSGAGTQALTSGSTRLLVDVTTFDPRRSAGRASPTNYYDLGLLRIGVQGSYAPAFPIDAASMFIDLPFGATTLGYACFGTTAIRVTEQAIAFTRPMPWDRNPVPRVFGINNSYVGPTAQTALFTYTVPAGKLFYLASANVSIERSVLPTSSSGAVAFVQAKGQYLCIVNTSGGTVGQVWSDGWSGAGLILLAGDVVTGTVQNADSGGFITASVAASGYEFDA